MTEILLQSALAETNSAQVADFANSLHERCKTSHADKARYLVECPDCLSELVDAVRNRYFPPPIIITTSSDLEPPPQPIREWFANRRPFLSELDSMLAELKARRIDPADVDTFICKERAAWYVYNVRALLVRLLVEDQPSREAIFEKVEDAQPDPSTAADDIAQILRDSPFLSQARDARIDGLAGRLAAAPEGEARIAILKETFFGTGEGEGEAGQEKYLDMLQNGAGMNQVVDRILEGRQAAMLNSKNTAQLKTRLQELKRARTAHELQKQKKRERKARLEEAGKIPDSLYVLPPCASCNKAPETGDFMCCPVCAVLVSYRTQEKPMVYCCDEHDEIKDHRRHGKEHHCASGKECLSPKQMKPPPGTVAQPKHRDYSPTLCFCRECLETHKLPTVWCSPECAASQFQRHRDTVHMPGRIKRNIIVIDRDKLEYLPVPVERPGQRTPYRARDINEHVIMYDDAVRNWEEENHIKLQKAHRTTWAVVR